MEIALPKGRQYVVRSEVVVTVLDETSLRRQALAKVETVRFNDEEGRRQMREAVETDTMEALFFLADHSKVVSADGARVHSVGFTVRPYVEGQPLQL